MENNNDLSKLFDNKEIDPTVLKAIKIVDSVSRSEEGNTGVDFTHYSSVETEIRKIKMKIESFPELKPVYTELMSTINVFLTLERVREFSLNAAFRDDNNDYLQVDSTSENEFYLIMKKIFTLQALLGNNVNVKYKAIIDELLEDFINIAYETEFNQTKDLSSPVKFYKKQCMRSY